MWLSKRGVSVLLFAMLLGVAGVRAQDRVGGAPPTPKNLQVLAQDVVIQTVMQTFAAGLGVQCGYCHVANDFASDGNPKKEIARTMLRMLKQINVRFPDAGNDFVNSKYLPFPEGKQYVTCYTCHRGSATPISVVPDPHGPDRAPEPGVVPNAAGGGRGRAGRAGGAATGATRENPAAADGGQQQAAANPPGRGNQIHKNMVYLPSNTDTTMVMPAFRAAIGVECNFCHVAGARMELGHANDRELDLNPKKLIARNMIGMLKEINVTLFPGDDVDIVFTASSTPPAGKHYVTCYTCHRGDHLPLTAPPRAASAR